MAVMAGIPAGWRRAAAAAYLGLVSWLSLLPAPAFGAVRLPFPHADKAAHAILYAGLAVLLRACARDPARRSPRAALAAALAATFCGAVLEVLQGQLQPGVRLCSAGDMLANAAGAAAVLALAR